MNPKFIPPVECIKCGKELKPLYDDTYEMVDGGIVDRIHAPYASRHDGAIFQIGICDDCIDAAIISSEIVKLGDYLERTSTEDTDLKKEGNQNA